MPPRLRAAARNITDVASDPEGPDGLGDALHKCLEPKASGADITRLHKFKECLLQMNWDSPDSLAFKSLIVRCFEARIFYKSTQGVNLLAIMMNLHPLLLAPIDEILKKCILAFPDTLLKPCSQMLLKAWQSATGGMRIAIEHRLIEWMKRALFTTTKTAERVRLVLNELHSTQRTPEIDELLSRFYGPVLMRNTKVANWEVRFNAIALLSAAFPVMPPDRTQIEFEEKLTIQFRVLKDAMEDPNELVRRCAVVGTGRILRDFWELLTIEQIAMVLDSIAQKAARDKSSIKTRQAAISALSLVVDNPLSHGVMNELLPGGCALNLMNDTSPVVRLKFAEFLVKISRLATLAIPRFIDQGILLARIATDHAFAIHSTPSSPQTVIHRQIASLLTRIVAPSVFSVGNGVEDQVTRCERLAEALPQALLAVSANCADATSDVDRVRLSVAIASRVVKLVTSSSEVSPRKLSIARVLLKTAIELMSLCPELAGVQGTESSKTLSDDDKKLADFIYRYITDRDTDRFVDSCLSRKLDIVPEVIDWLAVLDGTRLPTVYNRIVRGLETNGTEDMFIRLAINWGMVTSNKANIRIIENAVRSRSSSPDLEQAVISVIQDINIAQKLNRLDSLNMEGLVKIVQDIYGSLPNAKYIPDLERLLQSCLGAILQTHAASDLVSVLHPVNIGLIQSLNIAPVSGKPAGKKTRTNAKNSGDIVEYALNGSEMTNLVSFYVSYTLCCHLVAQVPLKALKFEELTKVLMTWAARADSAPQWENMYKLLVACTEAQAGPSGTFSLVEGLVHIETSEYPEQAHVTQLVDLLCSNYRFSPELQSLVTKLGISKDHERVHVEIKRLIEPPC